MSSALLTIKASLPVSRLQAWASTGVKPGTTLHTMTPSQAVGSTFKRPSKKRSSAAYSSAVQRGRVTIRVVNRMSRCASPASPPMQMLLLPMSTAKIMGVCLFLENVAHYSRLTAVL